jgi:hypothetical protein
MAKAAKARLLSFSTDDRPGLLAEVTARLVGAKVNITAICAYAMDKTAYFDMTVDSVTKAKKALAGLGVKVEEEDVVAVEMANKVGELDKVACALADAGINISYMYGTTSTGRSSTCIFATSDNKKALKVIK